MRTEPRRGLKKPTVYKSGHNLRGKPQLHINSLGMLLRFQNKKKKVILEFVVAYTGYTHIVVPLRCAMVHDLERKFHMHYNSLDRMMLG